MTDKPHIAVGVDGTGRLWNGHFGISPTYHIYDRAGALLEMRANPYGAGAGKQQHHDNPQLIVDLLPECGVFIARRAGEGSRRRLAEELGVQVFITGETEPEAALSAFLAEE